MHGLVGRERDGGPRRSADDSRAARNRPCRARSAPCRPPRAPAPRTSRPKMSASRLRPLARQVQHDEDRRAQAGRQRRQQHRQRLDAAGGGADHHGLNAIRRSTRCCHRSSRFWKIRSSAASSSNAVGMGREAQRLLRADAEEAAPAQRVAEQPDRAILQLPVEVDQHVAARHQLDLGEHAVGRQAVVGEDDVPLQALVEHGPAVARRVVVRQRARGRPTGDGSR